MIADFHRRGVRVLVSDDDVGPGHTRAGKILARRNCFPDGRDRRGWDQRRHAGRSAAGAYAEAAERIGHPLAFQPEGGPPDQAMHWNVMTWGQYKFPFAPRVDRYKWLETTAYGEHLGSLESRQDR